MVSCRLHSDASVKRFKTPGFATIITGLFVGIPVLVVDDKLMTDLTSIGTLFAFVLVCGGVLYLPKLIRVPGKFSIPYLNGKYIIPFCLRIFVFAARHRIGNALCKSEWRILPGNFIPAYSSCAAIRHYHIHIYPELFGDSRARCFILSISDD